LQLHFSSVLQHEPVTALNYVVKQPIGVAGLISPWNLPLYLLSFKIAPALAAGNTVVAKPSEFTSVTAWLLAHVFQEAGELVKYRRLHFVEPGLKACPRA
jgi:acyl-CoA reductase-like NAD-dependent aldehyde dehydrogenase